MRNVVLCTKPAPSLGGLLLIGLVAYLCVSKKKQPSTSTRDSDVENEMVKTGAAMS